MKTFIFSLLAILALTLSACSPAPSVVPTQTVQVQCEEDMPCWDCETMGNKICGNIAAHDTATLAAPMPHETVVTVEDLLAIKATLESPLALSVTAQLQLESILFAGAPYIPANEFQSVTYTGSSQEDLTDGAAVWSVESHVQPGTWHTYHVELVNS